MLSKELQYQLVTWFTGNIQGTTESKAHGICKMSHAKIKYLRWGYRGYEQNLLSWQSQYSPIRPVCFFGVSSAMMLDATVAVEKHTGRSQSFTF